MKILVAFSSKHGSTKGIADFIGDRLRRNGFEVDVLDVGQVPSAESYNAFVIGSALYFGHWMKQAKQFISQNKVVLNRRPVWLFSSGPTGKDRKDSKGRDLLESSVSGPVELDELSKILRVRDHRVFFGSFNEKDADFFTRQLLKSSTIRKALPVGDFRDWKDIEAWTISIANSLQEIPDVKTS
jgi:menaquinone-dependent protoporphyrinogen oxidase